MCALVPPVYSPLSPSCCDAVLCHRFVCLDSFCITNNQRLGYVYAIDGTPNQYNKHPRVWTPILVTISNLSILRYDGGSSYRGSRLGAAVAIGSFDQLSDPLFSEAVPHQAIKSHFGENSNNEQDLCVLDESVHFSLARRCLCWWA